MILPLTNNPSESFSLNINDVVYKFKQKWNTIGFWTLDIFNKNGEPLIYAVKLVAQENLLSMHPKLPFDLRSEKETNPKRYDLVNFELQILDK